MRTPVATRAAGAVVVGTIAAAILPACARTSSPPAAPAPAPEAAAAAGSTVPLAATGPVRETEFKALHQLRTDEKTPTRGTTIDLGGTRAYLSLPAGARAPLPAIVVVHEWWGLNRNIELWADRLAGDGWAALASDLYGGQVATTPDDAIRYMKGVDPAAAAKTITAAIDFLGQDPRIRARTRAVVGWCYGGGWSLQAALAHPELDGAIIYYGRLDTDPAHLRAIKARVLGFFGNQDPSIPPAEHNRSSPSTTRAAGSPRSSPGTTTTISTVASASSRRASATTAGRPRSWPTATACTSRRASGGQSAGAVTRATGRPSRPCASTPNTGSGRATTDCLSRGNQLS